MCETDRSNNSGGHGSLTGGESRDKTSPYLFFTKGLALSVFSQKNKGRVGIQGVSPRRSSLQMPACSLVAERWLPVLQDHAAALLPVAERIDPALIDTYLWRAMALRSPPAPKW